MDVPQEMAHGYVSDSSDFDQVIWEYEHRDPDRPLFLFNVTIQNHGSYTDKTYPAQVQLTDEPGAYPMAEQYLTLAGKTDAAFRAWWSISGSLTSHHRDYVRGSPALGGAGLPRSGLRRHPGADDYGAVYGQILCALCHLGQLSPARDGARRTDQPQLPGQYLLRYAGIAGTPYGDFLWAAPGGAARPHLRGLYGRGGPGYSHLETNDFTARIEDYQRLQYNNLFGGQDRLAAVLTGEPRDRRLTKGNGRMVAKGLLFG